MLTAVPSVNGLQAKTPARQELAAMRALVAALEDLPNDAARLRVLRWAIDIFGAEEEPVFEAPRLALAAEVQVPPVAVTRGAPPVTVLRVDPFLAVDSVEELFDTATLRSERPASATRTVRPAQPAEQPAAEPAEGVSSMLHGFVTEFQKLARDWKE